MSLQIDRPNAWDRIVAIVEMTEMTTNRFAKYIGLPRGENLYQIKRGNNGISLDLAESICIKFPQINKLWLLTGEGKMFLNTEFPAGIFFNPFRGTRRDWLAGIAFAGLLAGGRFDNTPKCANYFAEEMETLLTSETESGTGISSDQTPAAPCADTYNWFLGMAMFGLLAGRCESTTCQHIKKFADDMYALNSGIAADISKTKR